MKGERALGKKLEEKMDGGCDGFCSVLHLSLIHIYIKSREEKKKSPDKISVA